ncbi:chemotaxis protein CheW [Halorussus gelatinilyticus]|uniref:Chemotaxis protein CheW n=1 Tax=Halorussus gelatinilyticus TaxID=2937524 RepID=A0A8U0IH52_9EURY|nr:chemotaxis protein CheW [Halorussus gelatinilyticus]UPW00420.1 chemotaxis protein CheW [Halorussus gelatinilyticus]
MPETVGGVQVLEFRLEDRKYCIDIAHVDEIVDKDELTPLPNSEPRVEGVMDLRGITTTIINPKKVLDLEETETGERVVVLESDDDEKGNVGWLIDAVNQVVSIDTDEVDESVESGSVRGIVRQDDDFVVWVKPEEINN